MLKIVRVVRVVGLFKVPYLLLKFYILVREAKQPTIPTTPTTPLRCCLRRLVGGLK